VLRVVLIFFALTLLAMPFLKLVGALLLVWIGVKLLLPEDEDGHGNIQASDKLWAAVKTVIVADLVMSVDNVIAIAGAAEGAGDHQMPLVIFGLLVSIPIIVWGSQLVIKLMDRFPIIITARRHAAGLDRRHDGGHRPGLELHAAVDPAGRAATTRTRSPSTRRGAGRAGRRHGRLQRRRSGQQHGHHVHPHRTRPLAARGQQPASDAEVRRAMDICVDNANRAIFNAANSNPQYAGMGTTLVVAVFRDNRLLVGHVGDSRAYRCAPGGCSRSRATIRCCRNRSTPA
jgi:YjbE family integral membrane protein